MPYYATCSIGVGVGNERRDFVSGQCIDDIGLSEEELDSLVEDGVAEKFEIPTHTTTPRRKKARAKRTANTESDE